MKRFPLSTIAGYIQLCRPKIALFAALSAGFGLVLTGQYDYLKLAALLTGVFLIASGGSGLNQWQERDTDSMMARTKNRPIPSGRISPTNALQFSLTATITGTAILYASAGVLSAGIGLFAAGWYNAVYTYLKRKTAFAAIPGGLTGSLVPAIGWAAGNGYLADPRVILICIFFGLWQVPHFWLLVIDHGREYERAGLPSLTRVFNFSQISRIITVWIFAIAATGPMLCLFNPAGASLIYLTVLCISIWLAWQGARFMISGGERSRALFVKLNIYIFVIMTLLCCNSVYQVGGDIIMASARQIVIKISRFLI
jgi:heme o synthase